MFLSSASRHEIYFHTLYKHTACIVCPTKPSPLKTELCIRTGFYLVTCIVTYDWWFVSNGYEPEQGFRKQECGQLSITL